MAAAVPAHYVQGLYQQFPLARITDPRDPLLRNSVDKIAKKHFASKDFIRTLYYPIDWAGRFMQVPAHMLKMRQFFHSMKNAISMADIYGSLVATIFAVQTLAGRLWNYPNTQAGEVRAAVLKVGREFSDLTCNVCDTAELLFQWFPFSYMPFIDLVGSTSTFLGSINNFVDDGIKLAEAETQEMRISYGFNLAIDMSYMMVGAFGLYAWWISAPVSIILIPLTTGSLGCIAKRCFDEYMNPDGEHADPVLGSRALNDRIQVERGVRDYRAGFPWRRDVRTGQLIPVR